MEVSRWLADNPNGDLREYFAGMGNLLMAGAVGLVIAMYGNEGALGWFGIALGLVAMAVTFLSGVMAMKRFVSSVPSLALGLFLAIGTGFFSLLVGGLLGVSFVAILGSALA